MVIFAALVAIGAAAEQLFLRIRAVRFVKAQGAIAAAGARLLPVVVFAFVIGMIFFAFDWPPLARIALLTFLIAFVAYRFLSVLAVFSVESDRLLRRARLFIGILVFALAIRTLGTPLGIDPAVTTAIAYCFSIMLLLIAMEAIWRTSTKSRAIKGALSLFLFAIWVLWCLDLKGLAWIGIYALTLPGILKAVGRSVEGAISAKDGSRQNPRPEHFPGPRQSCGRHRAGGGVAGNRLAVQPQLARASGPHIDSPPLRPSEDASSFSWSPISFGISPRPS